MIETAFAKINLALHVRKRREDGYHELETLFAFVDAGDQLSVAPAPHDTLRTVGEFGGELTDPFGNIVMQALSALPRPQGWAVTLEKIAAALLVRTQLPALAHGIRMAGLNGIDAPGLPVKAGQSLRVIPDLAAFSCQSRVEQACQ